jgi:hypothetical protein
MTLISTSCNLVVFFGSAFRETFYIHFCLWIIEPHTSLKYYEVPLELEIWCALQLYDMHCCILCCHRCFDYLMIIWWWMVIVINQSVN